jgi:lambda repressor-like predicted transcriptional regulator
MKNTSFGPSNSALLNKSGEAIATAYKRGGTLETLAKKYGVATRTILNVLIAMGVERRARGPRPDVKRHDSIVRWRERGWTLVRIADKLGTTRSTVHKVLATRAPHLLGRLDK